MYKLSYIIITLALMPHSLSGQQFDYEHHKVIADSLIHLALLNTPEIDQQDYERKIRHEKIKRERLGWLSSFRMGVQFLTVNQDFNQNVTRVGLFNNLGVSLQVDFERFFTTPSRIKSARHELSIIKLEKERMIKVRRAEVLSFYYDYLLLIEQTRNRYATLQSIKEQGKLIEERFRNGETDLSSYLQSVSAVDNATEAYYETKIASEKVLALLENEVNANLEALR